MASQKLLKGQRGLAFVFVFALVLFPAMVFAQDEADSVDAEQLRIAGIETRGNITITRGAIISAIRSRTGQLFSRSMADKDIELIAAIEGVARAGWDVEVVDDQVKLIITIAEHNLVRGIVFNGNRKFSTGRLAKELGFKKGDYLDIFLARNAVESLVELYLKKGFADVRIVLDEAEIAVGQVVYNIEEGPKVKIASVSFSGNTSILSKELQKAIKSRTRKFFFWPVYYNAEQMAQDVVKLREIYQKKAFLDARVEAGQPKFSADGKKAHITFLIDEGPVYIVDKIAIHGNTFFDTELLRQEMKLKRDWYYSNEKAEYDVKHLRRRYLEQGFVDVSVEHRRSFSSEARVTAEFIIEQGQRFRIGQVIITGNEVLHDSVIRRILDEEDFKPGQWYNADLARGSGEGELEKFLRRMVLTESARITPAGTGPGRRDALVNIVEGQTGSIILGAGVASDSGLVGQIIFDQRNFDIMDWPESTHDLLFGEAFRGAGQRFRISLNPGTVQSTFSVSFSEPYLYNKPVSLDVVASGFERGRESYDEDRLKGYVGFEKRYPDDWRRGISFRVENVDVTDLEVDAPKEIVDIKGDNGLLGVRFFIRKDTTDLRFTPSRGYNFNAGYEQVGGDHTFGRLDATQRWYTTLHEDLAERKTILETKIQAATVVGDAPAFEKFYGGGTGAYSIRGFDYRGVSTRGLQRNVANPERKDPIGSDWIIVGNAEVAVPLTTEIFSWLFFVDAGAIDTGGVRASVGTGIQILLPQWFGPVPMRFELAAPFMKDDEDDTRVFSFSVGALF